MLKYLSLLPAPLLRVHCWPLLHKIRRQRRMFANRPETHRWHCWTPPEYSASVPRLIHVNRYIAYMRRTRRVSEAFLVSKPSDGSPTMCSGGGGQPPPAKTIHCSDLATFAPRGAIEPKFRMLLPMTTRMLIELKKTHFPLLHARYSCIRSPWPD